MTPQIWSDKALVKVKLPRRNATAFYKVNINTLSRFITNQKREIIDFRRDQFSSKDIDTQYGFVVKADLFLDSDEVWHELADNTPQKRQLDFVRQQMLSRMVTPNDALNLLPLLKNMDINIDQISAIIVNFKKNNEVNKNWSVVCDIIKNSESQKLINAQYLKTLEDFWTKNSSNIRMRWENINIQQKGKYEIKEILILGQKNLVQFSMKRFDNRKIKVTYAFNRDSSTEKTISVFRNK